MPAPRTKSPHARTRSNRRTSARRSKNGPVRTSKWLPGIPEWEAMKAHRRNLSHAAAVRECAYLSAQYRQMRQMVEISVKEIRRTLRLRKVPYVLTGAHGISSWTGRPRATYDVDLLVRSGRNYSRAVSAIKKLYPHLEARLFFGVTGFFVPGETDSVIDVTYPHRADQVVTLETAIWVEEEGERYRIPTLETALANKYGAMLTPNREPGKRAQDAVDFYVMVKHSTDEGRTPINMTLLAELGEKVWPGGGGKEIAGLVEGAKAGKVPSLSITARSE